MGEKQDASPASPTYVLPEHPKRKDGASGAVFIFKDSILLLDTWDSW